MTAVRYELADGVAVLTLDQPDSRNALTTALVDGLGEGLERASADPAVRVIVLTNAGTTFCAGADLRGGGGEASYTLTQLFELMLDAPKPVVGRIAGHCLGGGLGLAAACDISIAADEAKMGFTEVRLGVVPAVISVVVLSKLRLADANELMLTGRRFTATKAVGYGLVNRAVPAERLDAEIHALVQELIAGGPSAQAHVKRMIRDVPGMPRDEGFATMSTLSRELFASDEAAEGIAAFRERRPPVWPEP